MTPSCLNSQESKKKSTLNEYRSVEKKKLIISLILTLTIMVLELIGGLLINSIALVSDAIHMFTHSFAIMIGLAAIYIAQKPPCHHKTYGLYRSEVLAAFINGLFLLFVVIIIIFESIERILYPAEINGVTMLFIALIGLSANITSILILQGSHKSDLNIKGVFYHMFADAAASVGIVFIAIIIIYNPSWTILDAIISICISMVILIWAVGILKDTTRILLEITPKGLNVDTIGEELKNKFDDILDIYHVHLWTITSGMFVFSAHIKISTENSEILKQEELIEKINGFLKHKYQIVECIFQFTVRDEAQSCFFKRN